MAMLLLLVAMFLPPIPIRRAAYDTIVVFDITQSMNVEDYEMDGRRVSRLTFARDAVRRVLRDLPCGSRVGWAVFAEYRTLILLAPIEVCGNYGDLLASLDRIDGRMRWGNALEFTAEAGPGDFIYVPPWVPHQEINASASETLECVLCRSDGEAVAVNVDIEPVEKPETVRWIDPTHPHG